MVVFQRHKIFINSNNNNSLTLCLSGGGAKHFSFDYKNKLRSGAQALWNLKKLLADSMVCSCTNERTTKEQQQDD